MSSVLS